MATKKSTTGVTTPSKEKISVTQEQAQEVQTKLKETGGDTTDDDQTGGQENPPVDTQDQAGGTEGKAGDQVAGTAIAKNADDEISKIAREIFAKKKGLIDALYFTSDKIPFASKNDALKHALTLKSSTIISKTRGQ